MEGILMEEDSSGRKLNGRKFQWKNDPSGIMILVAEITTVGGNYTFDLGIMHKLGFRLAQRPLRKNGRKSSQCTFAEGSLMEE